MTPDKPEREKKKQVDLNGNPVNKDKKSEKKKENDDCFQLNIDLYLPHKCPECNSQNIRYIETRRNEGKSDTDVYKCRECGKKLTDSPTKGSRYDLSIIAEMIELRTSGINLDDCVDIIIKGSAKEGKKISLTKNTITYALIKYAKLLRDFEIYYCMNELEWKGIQGTIQIDDTPQMKKKELYCWIINILDILTGYWTVALVTKRRDTKIYEAAYKKHLKIVRHSPAKIIGDGLKSQIKAAKNIFRNSQFIFETKKKNYGIVNAVEGLHSWVRRLGLRKRANHGPLELLQAYMDLYRVKRNFLTEGKDGLTPAQRLGIKYPRANKDDVLDSDWERLIDFAYRYLTRVVGVDPFD